MTELSDNELAALHVRHMVGGRSPTLASERLYRVEFPERQGALLNFLEGLGGEQNITMFHYRNHGAAFGPVLIRLQGAPHQSKTLARRLQFIGHCFWEESENPARDLFL